MFKEWIDLGLKMGFSDIEFYSSRSKTLSITVYQGKVENFENSDVTGVRVRAIYDGKLVSGRIEDLTPEGMKRFFKKLKLNAEALTVKEPAIIFEGSKEYPTIKENNYNFDLIPVEKKIEYLVQLEKEVLKHELVTQVESSFYEEKYGETHIVNSKGLNLHKKFNLAYAGASAIFEKDGDIKTAYEIKLANSFEEFDANTEAEAVIKEGLSKVGGQPLKTGIYETVFSSKRFADMLQVYSGLFSGEAAYRKVTALKDKVGKQIANSNFTLWDNPLHELTPYPNAFDDEGVASFPKKIIDQGVFTGFLHNLKTAALLNEAPTGNSFGGGIGPAGMYLEPGTQSFDELIKDIKEGFYVTDLVGLHAGVNDTSGDFSLQAAGIYIKDGKLDHPVKMVVLSGNWFELIKNVKAIGNDLKFQLSGVGSPTVYVGPLSVAGEEK